MVSSTTDRRLGLVGNTQYKAAVTVVATANVTLSGEQTIDGVALLASNAAGRPDRVLCVGQTDGTQNGIWDVSTGTWTRSKDANGSYDLASGTQVIVAKGTHAFEVYVLATADPIVIDTTSMSWQSSLNAASQAALAAAGGSALVGFIQAGTGAVARTAQAKMRDFFNVKDYGALGNGSTNDYAAIQAAIDHLETLGGGTLYFPPGDFRHGTPLRLPDNIHLIGAGVGSTYLTKTGSGTLSVGSAANTSLVCLDLASQGSAGAFNGSIWISSTVRAENIEVAHMTVRSTGTAATTANAEIGIGGVGFSEGGLHHLSIEYYSKAAIVLPVTFANSAVHDVRMHKCERGLCIEAGTSNLIYSNYARYCHRVGFFFRDMSYSTFRNLACDGLNNVSNSSDYTDRTVDSRAYVINACNGVALENCGAEECFGTHVFATSPVKCKVTGCVFVSPASSYTGANQVAIFYVDSLAHGMEITDNLVFRNNTTALQGAAVAGNHHDLYASVASENHSFKWRDNWFCNTKYDQPSAIFGNMIPAYTSQLKQGSELAGDWTPVITLVGASGVGITYGANNKGRYSIKNGWMDIDAGIHLATSTYGTTTATVTLGGFPMPNKSAKSARLMVDESSTNFVWPTTEPYYCDLATTLNSGSFKNRNNTATINAASAFPSGTTDVYFHCSGRVYVGDVVNVIPST